MARIYSHELHVNSIAKRDQIRAWSKDGVDYVEGSGHWDTEGGVYMYVDEGTKYVHTDVQLMESEWDIFVMVKFQRK